LKSNDYMCSINPMNFAAFDLNLLRVFDALMRERSATRAGEQVGLSQPAVSAALNRLRDLLDDRLFVRQGNEMLPTPRAEAIAPGIQDALQSLQRLLASQAKFEPKDLERSFTLMGADLFSTLFARQLMARFAQVSSGLSLRFLDTSRGDVQRMLSDDAIDLALEPPLETPDWITSEQLFPSPFQIIVAPSHPLVQGLDASRPMPLDVFCALRWGLRSVNGSVRGLIDDTLEKIGRKREVVLTMPHFASLARCVADGKLAAVVPAQFAKDYAEPSGLAVFDLPFDGPVTPIMMHWHSRRTKDPAHAWLRQQVFELCEPFRSGY